MSNQDFINKIVAGAKKGYEKYGILPSVTIAQAINESGWGNSYLAKTDNNLFGIKYPGNHSPDLKISQGTWATDDGGYYSHYESWNDSVEDHGYFLANNSRYKAAIGLKDPSAQIRAIADAGYATEADYYSITMQILNENNLSQYDSGTYNGGDSTNSQSENITIEATNYQVVANSQEYKDVIFGRKYRITVSDAQGNGIDVSQLRCTFNIVKTIQMQPNTSEITIYNLNAQTENSIMLYGSRVTVEAGYEGSQFGLIFDGDILQTIREKEDSTTYKLTILALDSDRAINFEIANYSIVRGQTARSVINNMISKAQYPVFLGSISDKLDSAALTRGKAMFGKSSDYLRQIAKTYSLQYYMDDGKLNLINMEDLPEGEAFELNPESGLIGTPQQTDYGISGQCLLNPQIKLNTLIHIDNSLVRAKQINVNGNNTVPGATTESGNSNTTGNSARDTIIAEAKRLCNDPNVGYRWGGTGEVINGITYYDCSGFTQHCYSIAGLSINRVADDQWQQCKAKGLINIDVATASPGDLVFWFDGNGTAYHVAIYAGDNSIYAASTDRKNLPDQVLYESLYGDYKIGRPDVLINSGGGYFPSASGQSITNNNSQTLFRGLDKDGIYRVIKITFQGDTRGNSWFCNFETIDQLGGAIPIVSN
ncbi:glucosaminidase domain-containing protein [Clostridium sp.]|uniref:phage protein n=1 Tax=Clostridium sp. TaxID=1506 RepID=UPI002610521E|nr:glucosaminidase domain-containing protein [Clostridium sp.]